MSERKHIWHKCKEHPCIVCDGGLDWCVVCNQAEGDLEPTCPGTTRIKEEAFRRGLAEGAKVERKRVVTELRERAAIIMPMCEQEEGYRDGIEDSAECVERGEHAR